VYDTLMVSDTLHSYGRSEEGTRPGRTLKKPQDLSVCEREECPLWIWGDLKMGRVGVCILL